MSQPLLKDPIVTATPVRTGTGNGTVSVDKLTHFTTAQTYTLTCIAKTPDTIFAVSGSLDGPVGIATVGIQFFDDDLKIFLTIVQGSTAFEVGDQFVFTVQNGTDLHQDNIDLYDQLPQKNFGTGIKGQLKGDHNLRYSDATVAAYLFLQDLKFTSIVLGAAGNDLQVEYDNPVPGVQATGTLQNLNFTALAADVSGNAISVGFTQSVSTVKAARTIQNVNYQAQVGGAGGNAISVQYTSGGTAGAEVVTVIGNAISVQIESGVSTSAQIVAAVNAYAPAFALVVAKVTPLLNASPQTAPVAQTFLTGGITGSGEEGFEVVTVVGNAITVQCENTHSTLAEIKAALDASPAASALITTTITGSPSTLVASPAAPVTLTGGADKYGYSGFEKVTVTGGTLIKVFMESGVTTAGVIKAVFDATPAAAALASVTIVGDTAALQNGPVAVQNLHGGRDKYYAFNQHELTDAAHFFEGNASVKMQDALVQGQQVTEGRATFEDAVTLDDQNATNQSGPTILNAQQAINRLIEAGKMVVSTVGNLPVRYTAGQLFFDSDIQIKFLDTGVVNTILASNSPISIPDGQSLFFNLNFVASQNCPPVVSSSVPTSQQTMRLVSRSGSYLTWFNGNKQRDNDLVRIGGSVDFRDQMLSMLADGGIVSHSSTTIGLISWDAAIHLRPLGSSAEVTIDPASIQLNDGDVGYIQLDDPFVTATKVMFASPRTVAELSRVDRYWIFYRSGSKVWVRNGGTLVQGEERPIGEPISDDIFAFMGSQGETDTTPEYSTHGHTVVSSANRHVTDGENLVSGVKSVDTALAAHEDADTDVHGVGPGNQVVGTGTAQVLTNKDIDGGTATNTDRLTVPKNTSTALQALTRKEATLVYDTDAHRVLVDDGVDLKPVGSGGSVKVDAYDPVTTTLPTTTASLIDGLTITTGMLVVFDALSTGAHKIYKATVSGASVSWVAQSLFSTGNNPVLGDEIRVGSGDTFALALGCFDGTVFKFNDYVRYYSGTDYYEQSSLKTVAIAASTTAPVFTVSFAGSENMIVDFSILRGTVKEIGTLHITTDGVNAVVAESGTAMGDSGVEFAAAIVGTDIVLSYTTGAGPTGSMKFTLRRWSNTSGGTAGVPSYGAAAGSTVNAAGSNGQVQFNGAGVLSADAGFTYDPTNNVVDLNGLEMQGLKSVALLDAQGAPQTVLQYSASAYPFVVIEFSIKRDSNYLVGRLLIANNGSQVSMSDDTTEVGDSGITLLATLVGGNVVLQYFSTSTGFNAQLKYSVRRWT